MMNAANHKVVSTLNELIMICKDGQEGFRNAAGGVKSTELKTLFRTCAQQTTLLLEELRPEVQRFGGEPDKNGTLAGTFYRGWLNLMQILTGQNDQDVIEEAERSEDVAVHNYKLALEEYLPPHVRNIVERQYEQVKQVHERISALNKAESKPA